MSDQLLSEDPRAHQAESAVPAPPPAGPLGSERTRQDTSIIGVDHQQLQQSIANWASKLSPAWQKPAAMIATFPADVLASLAEMFSSPESIATGASTPKGMAALDAVQTGAGRGLDATGRLVEKLGTSLEKPARYFGAWELMHDPVKGTVTIAAPKVAQMTGRGMQRAGQALAGDAAAGLSTADEAALVKQGYRPEVIQAIERQLRQGATAGPGASAPGPAASVAAEAPASAPLPAAQTARPAAPAVTQATKVKLSAEEFDAAKRLVAEGYDPQDVLHEVVKARATALSPAEQTELDRLVKAGKSKQAATEAIQAMKKLSQGLPTAADVAASVTDRNASGRWPEQP